MKTLEVSVVEDAVSLEEMMAFAKRLGWHVNEIKGGITFRWQPITPMGSKLVAQMSEQEAWAIITGIMDGEEDCINPSAFP